MQKVISCCWGDDMRERRYLTFDMQNPRHKEAFELFTAQPSKLRSEFVVNCILESQEENIEQLDSYGIAQNYMLSAMKIGKTTFVVSSIFENDRSFTQTMDKVIEKQIKAS